MTGYPVVIEHEGDAWGAYVPDLPGCVATGTSRQEVEARIREAIPAHLSLMRQAGEEVPEPTAEGVIVVPAS
ncbi:MAG TPA: type II toxin-antitoxin system HicB family antitoxin [Acidimicrobiales bacterium]|nr:type II toxin-antitoxin system HicB family antitoxin [Acidimicrobiales bacterium]